MTTNPSGELLIVFRSLSSLIAGSALAVSKSGASSTQNIPDALCDLVYPNSMRLSLALSTRKLRLLAVGLMTGFAVHAATVADSGNEVMVGWSEQFSREVDHRLDVPLIDQQRYISMLQQALTDVKLTDSFAQAFLLVDRSPQVQAAMFIV